MLKKEKEKQTTIKKRGTSRYVFFVLHIRVPLCFTFFISIFIELGKGEQTHYKSQKRGINSFGSQLAPTSEKNKRIFNMLTVSVMCLDEFIAGKT